MTKTRRKATDELRAEYKRSDFDNLVCGKCAARVAAETNIVLLEPDVAEAFPNDRAVNDALRGLLNIAEINSRLTCRSTRRAKQRRDD